MDKEVKEVKKVTIDDLKTSFAGFKTEVAPAIDMIKKLDKDNKFINKEVIRDIFDTLIRIEGRISNNEGVITEIIDWNKQIEQKLMILYFAMNGEDVEDDLEAIAEGYKELVNRAAAEEEEREK